MLSPRVHEVNRPRQLSYFKDEANVIHAGCQRRFRRMQRAFRTGDVSIVECKDPEGRSVQVICVMFEDEWDNSFYTPIGLMITPALHNTLQMAEPPKRLCGEWAWVNP